MSRGPLASAEIRNRADTGVLRGPASSNPVNVAPVFRRIDFGIWEIGRYLVPAYRHGHGNATFPRNTAETQWPDQSPIGNLRVARDGRHMCMGLNVYPLSNDTEF